MKPKYPTEKLPGQSCLRSSILYFYGCCPSDAMSLSLHKRDTINLQSVELGHSDGRLRQARALPFDSRTCRTKRTETVEPCLSKSSYPMAHIQSPRLFSLMGSSRLCLHSLGSCSRPRNWIDGISQATKSLCWAESPVALCHVF